MGRRRKQISAKPVETEESVPAGSLSVSPVSLGSAVAMADTVRNSAASSGSNTSSPSPLDAPSNTSTELDHPDVIEHAGKILSGPLFEGMNFAGKQQEDDDTAANNDDSASVSSSNEQQDETMIETTVHTEEESQQDLEKRNQAFEAFKKLEDHYRKLFTKVMEEKERDLDRVEQSVHDGTHKNLIANLKNLEDNRLKALHVAETRKNLELQSIDSEYEDALKGSANSSVNQRDSLRKYLMYKLNRIRHEFEQESIQKEKAPAARRSIKVNPQAFHPMQKVRTVPYPVLEQYHWRRRQHFRILTKHATTTDERGDMVFPSFRPASLQPAESEQDLSVIRAVKKTLVKPAGEDVEMSDANKENQTAVTPSLKLTFKLPALAKQQA